MTEPTLPDKQNDGEKHRLSGYQKQIDDTFQSLGVSYWQPLSILARASEELGELARILNYIYGDKPKKPGEMHKDLGDEIADIIYTVLCLANREGINLDKPM